MNFNISGAAVYFRIPTGIPVLGDFLISETLVVLSLIHIWLRSVRKTVTERFRQHAYKQGAAKTDNRGRQKFIIRPTVKETGRMEGQNHSVKERLEQLETFMGKYTAGGLSLIHI